MTTAEVRAHRERDASKVSWTVDQLLEFRHCLALLAEADGQERVPLSASQLATFHAFPERLKGMPGSLGGQGEGIYLPRSLARFFGWWRSIETWARAADEHFDFDWVEATRLFVTDREKRRAWMCAVELAGKMDALYPFLPRRGARGEVGRGPVDGDEALSR